MRRLCLPIALAAAALLAGRVPAIADTPASANPQATARTVWKSPTCECCSLWMDHMAKNGFALEGKDVRPADLNRLKLAFGLKPEQAACHTAMIDGYVVEGHVPADDVKRLLAEKPDAIGLAVPRMPIGSPGMEMGDEKEPYEVLLVRRDGTTEVFARH